MGLFEFGNAPFEDHPRHFEATDEADEPLVLPVVLLVTQVGTGAETVVGRIRHDADGDIGELPVAFHELIHPAGYRRQDQLAWTSFIAFFEVTSIQPEQCDLGPACCELVSLEYSRDAFRQLWDR